MYCTMRQVALGVMIQCAIIVASFCIAPSNMAFAQGHECNYMNVSEMLSDHDDYVQYKLYAMEAGCENGDYLSCYEFLNLMAEFGVPDDNHTEYLWALRRGFEFSEVACYCGEFSACIVFSELARRNEGNLGCFVVGSHRECFALAMEMSAYACRGGNPFGCRQVAMALIDGWLGVSMCVEASEMLRLCCDTGCIGMCCRSIPILGDCVGDLGWFRLPL